MNIMTALHLRQQVRQERSFLFLRSFSIPFQTIQSCCDKLYRGQQLIVHSRAVIDSFQLVKDFGKLVFQSLVHSRIALHHHITAQQPLHDVVLLGQSRQCHSRVDQLVFFGRDTETDGSRPESALAVKVFR